ncbi:MAG: hypothetical protein HQM11_20420 [SAR324 cluster bacterium]|nr:hypothetical protein [SAR324 cluster bacterium]
MPCEKHPTLPTYLTWYAKRSGLGGAKATPYIAWNIEMAQQKGYPKEFNKVDEATYTKNRNAVTIPLGSAGKSDTGEKLSWDEYPFASTDAGGIRPREVVDPFGTKNLPDQGAPGAHVMRVPLYNENCSQGGCLGDFYDKNNIQTSSPFAATVCGIRR